MVSSPRRLLLPGTGHLADSNTKPVHPAEKAAWIWHPDKSAHETAFLRFRLRFFVEVAITPLLHVTGDQRFQLRCDGNDVTFGPDRCDREHWTVQSIRLDLAPGEHELEAIVWYLAESSVNLDESPPMPRPPMAQISWRGGFLLCGEDAGSARLTTGEAAWQVEDITDAVAIARPWNPHYHDVGPSFTFDLSRWVGRRAKTAVVVAPPLTGNPHGVRRPGWCLFPAALPEQRREIWQGGRIRAFRPSGTDEPVRIEETQAFEIAAWQELIEKGTPLTIPPNSQWTIIWDLEDYRCGYPVTETEGGKGAEIEWSWAEALYEETSVQKIDSRSAKGHRDEIVGKVFLGLADSWRIGSDAKTRTPALWWRCGRFVRARITTTERSLTLIRIALTTTGYPLDLEGAWQSSDFAWDRLMPLFERSYRIAAHETWTDTPYYEQMCYVGDNLLNALSNYAWFGDARLSRRSLQLYEWSRHASGLVAERYPSGWRQESATFSLLWPIMIRDYAWWRDDVPFVKAMLPGLRSVLAEFDGLANDDGLLHQVPGWPFIDWVPGWYEGCGPGVREGDSSIVNLYWVLALLAAAQVEEAHGDPLLAERNRQLARRTFDRILDRYWDTTRGLLLDTHGQDFASEHAQMFAVLTGLLDQKKTEACLAALRREEGLAKATISASFYLLEALYQGGEESEFHRRLEFWRGLPGVGFKATPEAPEPSRSDSHPWGAHPAWHTLASIAGVRPDAPGFARVLVAPLPGGLEHFEAKVVHPRGAVEVRFCRNPEAGFLCTVTLPQGVTGRFVFQNVSRILHPGKNEIHE